MEGQSTVQKPQSVGTAVNLLWASLALDLIGTPMDWPGWPIGSIVGAIVAVVVWALSAFLIFKVSAGKNWARITYFVLWMIGVVVGRLRPYWGDVVNNVVAWLFGAEDALTAYAFFLLFTQPGSSWFRKSGAA